MVPGPLLLALQAQIPPIVEYQWPRATSALEFACGPARGRLVVELAETRGAPPRVSELTYDGRRRPPQDLAVINESLRPFRAWSGGDALCLGLDPTGRAETLILVFRGYGGSHRPVSVSYVIQGDVLRPSTLSFHKFPPFLPQQTER